MYSKSVVYRFTSFASAKIAAGHCTENLSKFVMKFGMSSLTITVSKESEVSITATFDDIANLKKFDEELSKFVIELREAPPWSTTSHLFVFSIIKVIVDPKPK